MVIGSEKAEVVINNALHLAGAVTANAEVSENDDLIDRGQLAIAVGDLFVKHIYDYKQGEMFRASVNSEKTGSIGFAGENFERYVKATIGQGNLTVNGTITGEALNRDLTTALPPLEGSEVKEINVYFVDPSKLCRTKRQRAGRNLETATTAPHFYSVKG